MELYWGAVARLAWDLIRDKALADGTFREEEVKEWDQFRPDEQLALTEFAKATGKVLNG